MLSCLWLLWRQIQFPAQSVRRKALYQIILVLLGIQWDTELDLLSQHCAANQGPAPLLWGVLASLTQPDGGGCLVLGTLSPLGCMYEYACMHA